MKLTGSVGERLMGDHESELRIRQRRSTQQLAALRRECGLTEAEREAKIRRPSHAAKALIAARGHSGDEPFRERFHLNPARVRGQNVGGTLILQNSEFAPPSNGVLPVDVWVQISTGGSGGGASDACYLGTVHEPTRHPDSRTLQDDSLLVHGPDNIDGQPISPTRRINPADGIFLTYRLLEAAAVGGIPPIPEVGPIRPV